MTKNQPQKTDSTSGLNDKQAQAVRLPSNKNALILAGAGSGKTRVLTQRIVQLLNQEAIGIDNILAVTFTNKAANEMRLRLEVLLRQSLRPMWLGTFHSIACRILRAHSDSANLRQDFQILDSQDQFRLVRKTMQTLAISETRFPAKKIQAFINQQKDEGLRAEHVDAGYNYFIKQALVIYQHYDQQCIQLGVLDFAELLLRCHELLRDNAELLSYYQKQFRYLLIDEFQDTNRIQYAFIRLLFNNNHLFCVGDDDQSIYGWRGAQVGHIENVTHDFKPIEIIRLEQNYRSSGHILNAANHLIGHNKNRLGKSLWTDSGDGEKIDVYAAYSDIDEAVYVVNQINHYLKQDYSASQCAILYRSNAQSRVLEEQLIKAQIPYVIYGGLRFFERAEIKDALAYLRLTLNVDDDNAFERVVNFPSRGIGQTTLGAIRNLAQNEQISLWQASQQIMAQLSARARTALQGFFTLIDDIKSASEHLDLGPKIETILDKSTLLAHYDSNSDDKLKSKVQNLEELIVAANQYQHDESTNVSETIGFLTLASLESSTDEKKNQQQSVHLMTVHSAKGLEFPFVFVVGLEEDLFPSRQSKDAPELLSEERRLCYVAMTRAMKKLHLSHADKRFLRGQTFFSYPARFLKEIPAKHKQLCRQGQLTDSENQNGHTNADYQIGDTVEHTQFGVGTVLNIRGSGESMHAEVNFKIVGSKWLVCQYARLEKI